MFQRLFLTSALVLALAAPAFAQTPAPAAATPPAPAAAVAPPVETPEPVAIEQKPPATAATTTTPAAATPDKPTAAAVPTADEQGPSAAAVASTEAAVAASLDSGVIDTVAKQAYMIDYDTGTVLFDKNSDVRMPTSSMSKTLTAYVVFEALKNGQITMDTMYPVSERAWRMQGSKMFVELNKEIKVGDLLQGVIVQSGNDATVVLAEGLAGTEGAFAEELNKTAQKLGMKNSHFVNASGWPDPDHYSTAQDLAILGRAIIHDFPEDYKYFDEKEFTYNSIKQGNRNPLLYRGIGADGIKTGHTEDGGYGLIGSATMNGRRVIVVMNGMANMQERADESAKLIEWGLRAFENHTLFKAGDTIDTAPVVMGIQDSVPLVVQSDAIVTVRRIGVNDLKAVMKYDAPLKAPVKKGTQVGTVEVTVPGETQIRTYPLVTGADVPALGFFKKAIAHMQYTFGGHKVAEAAAPAPATVTQ